MLNCFQPLYGYICIISLEKIIFTGMKFLPFTYIISCFPLLPSQVICILLSVSTDLSFFILFCLLINFVYLYGTHLWNYPMLVSSFWHSLLYIIPWNDFYFAENGVVLFFYFLPFLLKWDLQYWIIIFFMQALFSTTLFTWYLLPFTSVSRPFLLLFPYWVPLYPTYKREFYFIF